MLWNWVSKSFEGIWWIRGVFELKFERGDFVWEQIFFPHPTFTAKHSTMHKTFMKLNDPGIWGKNLSRVLGGGTCEILVLVVCPLRQSFNIDMPLILVYSVLFKKKLIESMSSMQFFIFRHAFCTRKTTRPSLPFHSLLIRSYS